MGEVCRDHHSANTSSCRAGLTDAIYRAWALSPPAAGKTTLLREIIREVSYGNIQFKIPGLHVGLVDERSEIAGSYQGLAQLDVGPRTDLLDGRA